jgi:two-component system OmpR family sensor kinase
MKKIQSRFALLSIVLTTFLSLGIGGFATLQSRSAELEKIDSQLMLIQKNVNEYTDEEISAALFTIEIERLDVTLSLLTTDGNETIINESKLEYAGSPGDLVIKKAIQGPLDVDGVEPYRLNVIPLRGGDLLLTAASLKDLESGFRNNLEKLAIFTVVANSLAIFISLLLLSRHNRRLDEQALNRMKSFLADASHELRTPLTVIKGYTEMLGKNKFAEEADKIRAFSRVESEIIRMESLIHDLLLLAELGESKPISFEEVDVAELVRAHATDFITLNPARQVNLVIPDECLVQGERDHLDRLMQNILTNISRHTPSAAPVRIELRKLNKSAHLVVEDGGPGLPESGYKSEIKAMRRFDPSRSRETGGSGLGLSIISAIVQEHRGKLSLRKSSLGGLAVEMDFAR